MTQEQFETLIEMFSIMIGMGAGFIALAIILWCVVDWWFD